MTDTTAPEAAAPARRPVAGVDLRHELLAGGDRGEFGVRQFAAREFGLGQVLGRHGRSPAE